jgi:hypothetical protein
VEEFGWPSGVDVIEFIEIARVMGADPGQLFSKIAE